MDIRRIFAIDLVDLDIGSCFGLHGMQPTTTLPPRPIRYRFLHLSGSAPLAQGLSTNSS